MRNFELEHLNNIDSWYDIRLLQIKVELSDPPLPVNHKRLSRSQSSGVLVSRYRFRFSFTAVGFKLLNVEGQQLRYCGYGAKHDDIFIKGDPNELKVLGSFDLISTHDVIQLILKVHRVLHQSRQGRGCFKVFKILLIHNDLSDIACDVGM